MSLQQFHSRLKNILGRAGYSQQQLASALNLHSTILSNKLLGVRKGRLTNHDIKNIIKTLARWEAIFSQKEVVDLLNDLDLSQAFLSQEDWQSEPLNRLDMTPAEAPVYRPPVPEVEPPLPENSPAEISQLAAPAGAAGPGPVNTNLTTSVHHRPDLMTRLIGREEMLEELDQLMSQPQTRLVSLIGPGGIGKTRAALAVAEKWVRQQKFKDGIFFVELDKLTNAELVSRAILDSLSLEERLDNAPPFEILCQYLQGRQVLFILDNFEHVMAATPLLADLLASAPSLKFVVTSRVTMGIYGEWEFVVPPLPLPEIPADNRAEPQLYPPKPAEIADLSAIALSPAVALFIERARAINYRLVLTGQNAPVVVKICQLLEGLPLALELAAARTRLFGLEGVLQQLQQSYLQVLNDGQARLRKERHRSLQASLDWSYRLLSAGEQQLFCRLALFIDGFNIETVSAVVPPGGLGLHLYEGLENLLNKSLLTEADESPTGETALGQKRYRMLQPIREYALERLKDSTAQEAESGEWPVYRDYARFWVSWVKQEIANLEKTGDQASYNRLHREYANIREVLELALRLKQVETVVGLVGELSYYWNWRSQFNEWLSYIDATLELDSRPVADNLELMKLRATMLFWSGFLAIARMDLAKTKKRVGESLQIFTALGDKFWLARSFNCLGFVESSQGNHEVALKYLHESLALRREQGVNIVVANGLGNLAVGLLNKGDDPAALEALQEAHKLFREGDYELGVANLLSKEIAYVAIHRGDYAQGAQYLDEGIRLAHKINNNEALHYARTMYGITYYWQGRYAEARQSLKDGLAIAYRAGDNFGILHNLAVYPAVLLKLAGQIQTPARQAAALLGMLCELLEEKGIVLPPMFRELMDNALNDARAALGPAVFEACRREGEQRNLKETVDFVLQNT